MYDLRIINGQVYYKHEWVRTNIYINGDHIVSLHDSLSPARKTLNAKDRLVFPGIIDPHVHFALDVGAYPSADDFYKGSMAAAFGGVTTIIDFLDPISTARELKPALLKRTELAANSMIDFRFHATVADPKGQVDGIVEEMKNLGIGSVKLFTAYEESGRRTFPNEIKRLLELSEQEGFVVLGHLEEQDGLHMHEDYNVEDMPLARPVETEIHSALEVAQMVQNYGGRFYMVHMSSGKTLRALQKDYGDLLGTHFFIESCPHYFYFNEEKYTVDKDPLFLMTPPLRDVESQTILRNEWKDIHTIGTDHCPFSKEEKSGKSLIKTPMGVGGVDESFSLMYSLYGDAIVPKMTEEPAKIFGLYPKKGVIDEGGSADLFIYNPHVRRTIGKGFRDYNIYQGIEVQGVVEATLCQGNFVVRDGELVLGSIGHRFRL